MAFQGPPWPFASKGHYQHLYQSPVILYFSSSLALPLFRFYFRIDTDPYKTYQLDPYGWLIDMMSNFKSANFDLITSQMTPMKQYMLIKKRKLSLPQKKRKEKKRKVRKESSPLRR